MRHLTIWVLASLLLAAGLTGWILVPRPVAQAMGPVPVVLTAPAPPSYAPFGLKAHMNYILRAQRPTGAIALTPDSGYINPYFANLAAIAILHDPANRPAAERWIDWYLSHLNDDGTIDDFQVDANGEEQPTGHYDSADSYAATLLSLVRAYLEAGGDVNWVMERRPDLDRVSAVLVSLTDRDDGLTWAKPRYPLKLLMDNSEVFRGWADWAIVLERLSDTAAANEANRRAIAIQKGLERFAQRDGGYAWALAPLGIRRGSNPERFYPDGVAQFFPLAFGMIDDPSGYFAFRDAHPNWTDLNGDKFPWLLAALAAAKAGDLPAAQRALYTAANRYTAFSYPWYIGESAWMIRVFAAGVPDPTEGQGPVF